MPDSRQRLGSQRFQSSDLRLESSVGMSFRHGEELDARHLGGEADVEIHVLSEPVRVGGDLFVQCSCGRIFDVTCGLIEECSSVTIAREYCEQTWRAAAVRDAALSRDRSMRKLDAERFGRLRAIEAA